MVRKSAFLENQFGGERFREFDLKEAIAMKMGEFTIAALEGDSAVAMRTEAAAQKL
jgi:hypothetical protein